MGGAARPARTLVVLQVALSLVLVTATGLFARSFRELLHLDLGFEPMRVLTVRIDPKLAGVAAQDLPETYRRVLDQVARVPGVESAALAMCGLQGTCAIEDGYHVDGYQPSSDEVVAFSVNSVTPPYFTTVGYTSPCWTRAERRRSGEDVQCRRRQPRAGHQILR